MTPGRDIRADPADTTPEIEAHYSRMFTLSYGSFESAINRRRQRGRGLGQTAQGEEAPQRLTACQGKRMKGRRQANWGQTQLNEDESNSNVEKNHHAATR